MIDGSIKKQYSFPVRSLLITSRPFFSIIRQNPRQTSLPGAMIFLLHSVFLSRNLKLTLNKANIRIEKSASIHPGSLKNLPIFKKNCLAKQYLILNLQAPQSIVPAPQKRKRINKLFKIFLKTIKILQNFLKLE